MTHQRRVLRVFRWLAVGNVLFALNAAGVTLYLHWKGPLWKLESEGSVISRAFGAVQFEVQVLLLAGLVWVVSTAAERYLGGRPPGAPLAEDRRGSAKELMAVQVRVLRSIRWLALLLTGVAVYACCHHAGRAWLYVHIEEGPDIRSAVLGRNRTEVRSYHTIQATQPVRVWMLLAALVWIAAAMAEKYLISLPTDDGPQQDYAPSPAD